MGKSTTSRLASPIPLDPQQSSQLGARHFTDPLSRPGPPADAMTSALQQTTPAALILHLPSSNHPASLMRCLILMVTGQPHRTDTELKCQGIVFHSGGTCPSEH